MGIRPRTARQRGRGFTLVEAAIALAIVAIAASVVLPAVGNLSRAQLRKSASLLAGHIRSTFDQAALSGRTHRLVLDFSSRTVKVEATDDVLTLDPESNVLVEGARAAREYSELINSTVEAAQLAGPDGEDGDGQAQEDEGAGGLASAFFGINQLGSSAGSGGGTGFQDAGKFELEDGTNLLDVRFDGASKPLNEGEVYLAFFPHGYTQDAVVHIEDDDGRVFAVKIWGLTGKTEVIDHYLEAE